MSPICQTFVQNAWRKDLCSNCFKSEEQHGSSRKEFSSSSRNDYCTDRSVIGRRYVGVAGRPGLYSRNYYGSKSWNPLMLDNSNNDSRILKSPGLIKGMDSIIKQENEKNRNLSGFNFGDNAEAPNKVEDVISRSNIPKDSWILSQIIGESRVMKNAEHSERIQGDSSSDLGSDASHDTSVCSGNTSGCSEGEMKGDSDASSIKSEPDSAHEEEPPVHGILKSTPSITLHRTVKASISFKEDYEIIGYGGDVDYSDDEEYEDDDDDDDDNSSISSSELSPEDRYLKQLTEKNTNFNADNENLERDQIEEENDDESRHSYDLTSSKKETQISYNKNKIEKPEEITSRQDVKVKLKRSQPIVGAKPHIKSNFNGSLSNSVTNSLNTQTGSDNKETIPMQGIKPKFVSREDEMKENMNYEEIYQICNKVTSIDDFPSKVTSVDDFPSKVTSVDDFPSKVTSVDDFPSKVTSVDDFPSKVTSVDDFPSKVTSVEDFPSKVTSVDDFPSKVTSVDDFPSKVTSVDDFPSKVTSVDDFPSKVTSVDDFPSKVTSVDDFPSKVTSVDDFPSKVTSVDDFPSKVTSVDDFPSKVTSTDDFPSKVTSTDDFPSKRTSTDDFPSKRTSTDDFPSKRTSTDDFPSKRTSTDDFPSKRTSTDDFPSKRTSTDDFPSKRTSTDDLAPKRTSTDDLAPKRTSTDDLAPKRTSTDDLAPKRTSTDDLAPKRTSTDDLAPKRTSTDDLAPKRTSTDDLAPKRTSTDDLAPKRTSTDDLAPKRTSTDDLAPKRTSTDDLAPKRTSTDDLAPKRTSTDDLAPKRTSTDDLAPKRTSTDDLAPKRTSTDDLAPKRTSTDDLAPKRTSTDDLAPKRTSTDDLAPKRTSTDDLAPKRTSTDDLAPKRTSTDDLAPKRTSTDDLAPKRTSTDDLAPKRTSTDDLAPKRTSTDDLAPKRTSTDDLAPKRTSTDDLAPKRTSTDDLAPKRTSTDDLAPKRTSTDDLAPKRTSTDDLAPKRTSTDDLAPKRTSTDDLAPKRTSTDDLAPKRTSTDDLAPKRTSTDDLAPKRTSTDDLAPKRTSTDDLAPKRTSINDFAFKVTPKDDFASKVTPKDDFASKVTPKDDFASKVTPKDDFASKVTPKDDFASKVTPKDDFASKVTPKDDFASKVTPKDDFASKVTPKDDFASKVTPKDDFASKVTPKDDFASKVTPKDDFASKVTPKDDFASKVTPKDDFASKVTPKDDFASKVTPKDDFASKVTPKDDFASKVTPKDDFASKVTPKDDFASKVTPKDDFASKVTPKDDFASKVTPKDDFTAKVTLVDEASRKTATGDVISYLTCSNDLTRRVIKSTKVTNIDDCHKVSYVNDTSTYKHRFFNSSKSNSSKKNETEGKSCNLQNKELSSASVKENSEKLNFSLNLIEKTTKNKEFDYSVKSADNDKYSRVKDSDCKTAQNDEEVTKHTLEKIENSKENLEKVSSAVIPMNMITIQRRSSFMESQLGGTIFSIDTPLSHSSSCGAVVENHKGNSVSSKQNALLLEKETPVFQNKYSPPAKERTQVASIADNPLIFTQSRIKNLNVKILNKEKDASASSERLEVKQVREKTKENGLIQSKNVIETISGNTNKESVNQLDQKKNNSILGNKNTVKQPEHDLKLKSVKSINNFGKLNSEESENKNKINSNCNSLSTFGTPVTPANSSFLHSGAVRPVTEVSEINSIIYSTPEFLRGIKSHPDQSAVTASIQKSALYASSSCLKGVPLGKPATTPKPNYPKDKPKIPMKPFMSSYNIHNQESSAQKKRDRDTNTVVLDISSSNNVDSNATSETNAPANLGNRKPPPSGQAPKIPDLISSTEIVYDVPVTLSSPNSPTTLSAPSPSSSSSGYSTTSNVSQSCDTNTSSYQENKLDHAESSEKNSSADPVRAEDNDESHYRAKFEATRNILSESLSFENKHPLNIETKDHSLVPEESREKTKEVSEKYKSLSSQGEDEQATELKSVSTFQPQLDTTHSYINLHPSYDNHDVDSYSSFTDDFDDDDDDDDDCKTNKNGYNTDNRENFPPLRRTERSSSATPLFRNSVGPINFSPTSTAEVSSNESVICPSVLSKPPAVRSQSVPRSADNAINPLVFGKSKQESSSRFGFVKSGFFRPGSPPSMKRKSSSSERGRDRTKKSHSVFSLRKLLRFGSGEKSFKGTKEPRSPKEQERNYQRETRKLKLQIIHPLDYNTNGVEVISRPEKRSPTYDFTGINDPLIQEALRQHALEMNDKKGADPSLYDSQRATPSTLETQNRKEENSSNKSKTSATGKVVKKNSFLKRRRKPERNDSEKSDVNPTTACLRQTDSTSNKRDDESTTDSKSSSTCSVTNVATVNQTTANLGFNSEGRPRPPPPPRKTSLDANCQDPFKSSMNYSRHNSYFESNFSNGSSSGSKAEGDTSSLSSSCSSSTRPHRPPPPRRTPSSSGSSQGFIACRSKDSLYANLGNARASFTPRKPGRTSSIRDEEREKRRAPNPPPPPQQQQQQQQQQQEHLQQQVFTGFKDELNQALQTFTDNSRAGKGPAPPTPVNNDYPVHTPDYEYISNSPEKFDEINEPSAFGLYDLPLPLPNRNTRKEQETSDGYIIPGYVQYSSQFQREKQEPVHSSSSSVNEKMNRQRGRRGSVVTNLSLEDQYGAVVFANLEALSNMLDQMVTHSECGGYERVVQQVSNCSQISISSKDPISCGLRLFYPGTAANCDVTVMVTPETKIGIDPLLMPSPIVTLKDDIPSSFLPSRSLSELSFTSGSVWILPKMDVCSLEEFSHSSRRFLQERASEWERRICLFLLQIVSALKQLQAKGIEETSLDVILAITNIYGDDNPRLLMAPSEANNGNNMKIPSDNSVSLCHCAAAATQLLLGHSQPLEAALEGPVLSPPFAPSPHAFSALVAILREERSSSLTKAKCILETMLFGPEDMKVSSQPDGELALQKWLDLERANILHSLVREQASGSFNKKCISTKFHLLFLVRTNVKALKEAMGGLEAPDVTNF